jgi:hypothetical protein
VVVKKQKTKRRRVLRQDRDSIDFNKPISQAQFGELVGIPQQEVSQLCFFEVLSPGGSARDWNVQYLRFVMGQIFARRGWDGLRRLRGD